MGIFLRIYKKLREYDWMIKSTNKKSLGCWRISFFLQVLLRLTRTYEPFWHIRSILLYQKEWVTLLQHDSYHLILADISHISHIPSYTHLGIIIFSHHIFHIFFFTVFHFLISCFPMISPWFPRGHGPLGRHQHLRTQRRRARPHSRGAGADPQGAVRCWAPRWENGGKRGKTGGK